ncbi:MAG: S24/S26 family peptidase [Marinilabiliaceae bacterium]|nr:S24/S26 family peptidase [Marinilabiliaceae bacterium]
MDISNWRSIVAHLLNEGRVIEIHASGFSMFPLLRPGDKLQIQPQKGSFKSGDIIVFDRGDVFVAHRLIEIRQDQVICKGDGFVTYDTPIDLQQVVGKVTHRIRKKVSVDLSSKRYVWFAKVMLRFPRVMGLFFNYTARGYHKFFVD